MYIICIISMYIVDIHVCYLHISCIVPNIPKTYFGITALRLSNDAYVQRYFDVLELFYLCIYSSSIEIPDRFLRSIIP